jgi:hypothetical protein
MSCGDSLTSGSAVYSVAGLVTSRKHKGTKAQGSKDITRNYSQAVVVLLRAQQQRQGKNSPLVTTILPYSEYATSKGVLTRT